MHQGIGGQAQGPEDAGIQEAVVPEHQPADVTDVGRVRRSSHLLQGPKVSKSIQE